MFTLRLIQPGRKFPDLSGCPMAGLLVPAGWLILLLSVSFNSQAMPPAQDPLWTANGPVHTMLSNEDVSHLFKDGVFSYTGSGSGAVIIDTKQGQFDKQFPVINGPVYALASDGSGGWYIGGRFTLVGGVVRNNIAYISWDSDAEDWTVESWDADINAAVHALTLSANDNLLYVGGEFTTVNGSVTRHYLAVIKTTTHKATSWNPDPSGTVRTLQLAADNALLYIGGSFTRMEGGTIVRRYAAAIDTREFLQNTEVNPEYGRVTGWNPSANAAVYVLLRVDSEMYLGGDFTALQGGNFKRDYAALVGLSDGVVKTDWNPSPNGRVRVILVVGSRIYLGGDFTTLNADPVAQAYLAVVDNVNGVVNSGWNPGIDAPVYSLLSSPEGVLYLGGDFVLIDGEQRNRLAALDLISGELQDWEPDGWDTVRVLGGFAAILIAGGGFDRDSRSLLYIGGAFDYVGPVTGSSAVLNTAVLDDTEAVIDANFPRIDGVVYASVADGSGGWYIGGAFNSVNGVVRNNLVYISWDGSDWNIENWNPDANAAVYTLLLSASSLYVGGAFTQLGGMPRSYLGAVNSVSGALMSWDAQVNDSVRSLAISASLLYVGGDFTQASGVERNFLAAFDQATLVLDSSWKPNADAAVYALLYSGSLVYIGGAFSQIGGVSHPYLVAVHSASGVVAGWDAQANGAVHALQLSGTRLYVGGDFDSIGGLARHYLAALDTSETTSVAVADWQANADAIVYSLAFVDSNLYVGGKFKLLGGISRNRLAALTASNASLRDWNPSAGSAVFNLSVQSATVLVGGQFSSVGGKTRRNLAALELVSGELSDWNPGVSGEVRTLMLTPNNIYIGGTFSVAGGQYRNNLALLSQAHGVATSWNPGADGRVQRISPSGNNNTVLVAGTFSTIGNRERNGLAEVNVSGLVTSWNLVLDSGADIRDILLDDETLYLAGVFSISDPVSGKKRVDSLAAFSHPEGILLDWRPVVTGGAINTLLLSADQSRLYIGGDFSRIDSASRANLAALFPYVEDLENYVQDWKLDVSGEVKALILSRDRTTLYLGGDFNTAGGTLASIGGQLRDHLAAVRVVDARVIGSEWSVSTNAAVNSLLFSGDVVYVGGDFDRVNKSPRAALAAVDALPAETRSPVTEAIPPGQFYNKKELKSIQLVCDDGLGSGCAETYYSLNGSAWLLYRGLIELTEDTDLRFFSIDQVGNSEDSSLHLERYFLEIEAPKTLVSPDKGAYKTRSLTIILTCSDDSSGCANTYYTLDNSRPTMQTALIYTGPIHIRGKVVLKYFSVDQVGNEEGVKRASFISVYGGSGALDSLLLALFLLMLWRCPGVSEYFQWCKGKAGDGH